MGKAKWKLLELPLSRKRAKQKQYCILGGTAEITATMRDLKDAGVVILTMSLFNSPIVYAEDSWILENDNELL